ncbi:unnamed protein product [Ixodes pacificus]
MAGAFRLHWLLVGVRELTRRRGEDYGGEEAELSFEGRFAVDRRLESSSHLKLKKKKKKTRDLDRAVGSTLKSGHTNNLKEKERRTAPSVAPKGVLGNLLQKNRLSGRWRLRN